MGELRHREEGLGVVGQRRGAGGDGAWGWGVMELGVDRAQGARRGAEGDGVEGWGLGGDRARGWR